MGHLINKNGQFQSDKYPELKPDKIILSFKDKAARKALHEYIKYSKDQELSEDIEKRLADFD